MLPVLLTVCMVDGFSLFSFCLPVYVIFMLLVSWLRWNQVNEDTIIITVPFHQKAARVPVLS